MSAKFISSVLIVPFIAGSLFAGPKIEFDTKDFKCGNVFEGKTDKINATFNVKNIGDAQLKFTSVRPGCGCTVVKFDSLVDPGKSMKIEAAVNIANYRSGAISKYITVTSNAQNDSNVRLTIEATVMSAIDVSETYINLDGSDTSKIKTVILTSKKGDLKVSGVSFKAPAPPNTPEWRADGPLELKYTMTANDSTRADGNHVFKLNIYPTKIDKTLTGEITIKTNHPDKPQIVINTTIMK
jgi:hypothetical protein